MNTVLAVTALVAAVNLVVNGFVAIYEYALDGRVSTETLAYIGLLTLLLFLVGVAWDRRRNLSF